MTEVKNPEGLGSSFNFSDYLKAREKTISTIKSFGLKIKAGANEQEAWDLLNETLKEQGASKFWHPTKLRMNINTIKNFKEQSEPMELKESDIFFIDVGPVFYNHEGDYGETFVVGNDPQLLHLKNATKIVFDETQKAWREKFLTGIKLYEFASQKAVELGLRLNSNMYGHRLGDFPHALHFTGDLGEYDQLPSSGLWVLEIHLIDDSLNRGAFFEDILFRN